jgi:hypothetical protein
MTFETRDVRGGNASRNVSLYGKRAILREEPPTRTLPKIAVRIMQKSGLRPFAFMVWHVAVRV